MATPKGMRLVPVAINTTDVVHIYSDETGIWLQLRRDVPMLESIGKPSFKTAFSLTPAQAIAIAAELLAATKPHHKPAPATPAPATAAAVKTAPAKTAPVKVAAKKAAPSKPAPAKTAPTKPVAAKAVPAKPCVTSKKQD